MAEQNRSGTGQSDPGTGSAKAKAREIGDEARERVREAKHKAGDKADELAAEAKDRGGDLAREGKRKARSQADEQKDRLSEGLRTMAGALRRGRDEIPQDQRPYGRFLDMVAERAEDASDYLEEKDVDGITRDVRGFAREHTGLFLSGAFTAGMLGARFLKSSGSSDRAEHRGRPYPSERYEPSRRPGATRSEPFGQPMRPRSALGSGGGIGAAGLQRQESEIRDAATGRAERPLSREPQGETDRGMEDDNA